MDRGNSISDNGCSRKNGCVRLLIVATHPIQYQAPFFRALSDSSKIACTVGYLERSIAPRHDSGFGTSIQWDIDVLAGYESIELKAQIRRGGDCSAFMARRVIAPVGQLNALSPDIVLVMGWNQLGLLQLWAAARILGIPVLVRGDSNLKAARPWYKKILQRALIRSASAFLAVGKSNWAFYRARGVSAQNIVMAPHFIDNQRFLKCSSAVSISQAREMVGVPVSNYCIAFFGKLVPIKRVSDLISAVAGLPDKFRGRVTLLIVGSGPDQFALQALAESLSVDCVWHGFVNQAELPKVYRAADFVVLPSTHETWGLVANEAMACGIPIVVSDRVGCADDLVLNDVTGVTFKMGDVAGLRAAIERLLNDPALLQRLGLAAREHVFAHYSIEASVKATELAADLVMRC